MLWWNWLSCLFVYTPFFPCPVNKWAHMYVKVLIGLPKILFFLSCSGNSATGEQSSVQPLLSHCPLLCECVYCMYICVCLLPGINNVGHWPAGDSVEDDGCTRTSSAPLSTASAVEPGICACSCIYTDPRTTATAQSPPPGWGQKSCQTSDI